MNNEDSHCRRGIDRVQVSDGTKRSYSLPPGRASLCSMLLSDYAFRGGL
jgi:hypothetical protein